MSLYIYPSDAQDLLFLDSIPIPQATSISKDQRGNIYVADQKGKIIRYSSDLRNALVYSPNRPARITSMETWQGMRVLVFYRDIQEYTLLNRFLDGPNNYELNSPEFIFISAATLSYDNNLWLFDQQGMRLFKYNTSERSISFQKPLDLIFNQNLENIITFREYQNRIYLIDQNAGMYVFDNLGNYIFQIPFPEVNAIGFYKDYLYYSKDGQLISQHLYTQKKQEVKLPIKTPDFVLKSKYGIYIVAKGRMYRYVEK